jgi:lysozyme family protein
VNIGVRRAVRFLQSSLNLLDRDRRDPAELVVDGWLGDSTHAALTRRLKKDRGSRTLIGMLHMQQGARYLEIIAGDAGRDHLLRAWFERG